jgi:hypothetical protein
MTSLHGKSQAFIEAVKRPEAWSLLRCLSRLSPNPWFCIRNFNEIILSTSEKSSLSIRPMCQMLDFQRALEDYQLMDLGFCGPKYTWSNGRSGRDFTRERLDRAVANNNWSMLFDVVEVNVLARSSSDHNPLLMSFSNTKDIQWR